MLKRAVFLDRDGTINEDPGYLARPEQLVLLPGAAPALGSLKHAGFLLVVVTNQSGVGRGLIRESDLQIIHAELDRMLVAAGGVRIDHYEYCVHHPSASCACRKPKSKMILDAAKLLGIDITRSFMVGDKLSDLSAGRSAGCEAVALVRTGWGSETEASIGPNEADFIGQGLPEVAHWICSLK